MPVLRSAGERLPGIAGRFASLAAAARGRKQAVPAAPLRLRLDAAEVGSALAFLRDGGLVVHGLLRSLGRRVRNPLFRWLPPGLNLRGLETAWLVSGAAAQLADAALGGETPQELAVRIARIARSLTGADAAAVHGRMGSPGGSLRLLGSTGDCREHHLAERALAAGAVVRDLEAVAIPLQMGSALVGVLTVRYFGRLAGRQDLRPLQPLLSRAGAVLAAAEREARKDRFLSLAAHELKTPLTSIKGFAYSLSRRLERGEPTDPRHVQVLERQAERLHSLLEEMLEVSRLETGRFALHPEPCELRELVDSCHRSLRRLGQDAGLDTRSEDRLPLLADRERVERALSSMVERARSLGSTVSVQGRRAGDRAEVRVSWTGPPLSAREQEEAFAPRWEAPASQRQGLGMALFIARESAQLHGGSLRCEPRGLVLELPLREGAQEQRGGEEGRVLVVDDDEPLARTMADFLAESGFIADFAISGAAALVKIATAPPDLLVLDLRMPEMDGRALLKAVRATGLTPRVVLLSADRELAAVARELETDAFVEKPFAPESLLLEVRSALGTRAK